jgi:hypothetical protein
MASDRRGHRLTASAVRLAATHAACDVLGLERFDNEDLYGNLDWLSAHQREIEGRLFQLQPKESAQRCFSTTLPAVTWKANTMNSRPLAITAMANGQAPTCHWAIVQSLARRGPRRCNRDDFTERSSNARSPRRALRRRKNCSGELAPTICSRCRGGERQAATYALWAWTGVAGSGSLFTLLLLALVVLDLLR